MAAAANVSNATVVSAALQAGKKITATTVNGVAAELVPLTVKLSDGTSQNITVQATKGSNGAANLTGVGAAAQLLVSQSKVYNEVGQLLLNQIGPSGGFFGGGVNVSGAASSAASTVAGVASSAANDASSIANFLSHLWSPLRLLKLVGGILLLFLGLRQLAQAAGANVNIPHPSAVPVPV